MAIGHIWLIANSELRDHLHRASEERAAAFYAAFKAVKRTVAKPITILAERLRRAREARATYHALSGLSDHALRDIGLSRSEIREVALDVGMQPSGAAVTLVELRGIRPVPPLGHEPQGPEPDGHDPQVVPLPIVDHRRDRPVGTVVRSSRSRSRRAAS